MTFESLPENEQPQTDPSPVIRRRGLNRSDVVVGVLLVLVMLAGAYFRFVGQNWDDYTHLHPDERFLTGVASSLGGPLTPSGSADLAGTQVETCRQRYPETGGAATSIF